MKFLNPLWHVLVVGGLAAGLGNGCKSAGFTGGSSSAGGTSNSSGSPGGAVSSSPGNTDASGAGGSQSGVPALPGSTTTSGNPGTNTPSSTNTTTGSILSGLLGAAGSVINAATPQMPANMTPCSQVYLVPGTASPYMAGEPAGTSITYSLTNGGGPNPTDTAASDAPIQVQTTNANCLTPGNTVFFFVYGLITYDKSVAPVNGNGNVAEILAHQKAALFGKSNIVAPLCALIGVFLDDNDPSNAVAPGGLDFSTQAARDYVTLAPSLGQVFFIGTGTTSSGVDHGVVVPPGATRLFLAAMDTYQWNNNIGGVSAQLMVQK